MLVHSLLMKIKKRLTCDMVDTCAMPDLRVSHVSSFFTDEDQKRVGL